MIFSLPTLIFCMTLLAGKIRVTSSTLKAFMKVWGLRYLFQILAMPLMLLTCLKSLQTISSQKNMHNLKTFFLRNFMIYFPTFWSLYLLVSLNRWTWKFLSIENICYKMIKILSTNDFLIRYKMVNTNLWNPWFFIYAAKQTTK